MKKKEPLLFLIVVVCVENERTFTNISIIIALLDRQELQ
jgi:hypothetical protein